MATITEQEKLIFSDLYQFYKTTPPVDNSPEYWTKIMHDMNDLSNKHKHPLMDLMLMAVYQYLNQQNLKSAHSEQAATAGRAR